MGSAFRAVRIHSGRTQGDVAAAAMVPQSTVSRLERGLIEGISVGAIRSVATTLGMWVDITPRWRGSDLDRMLNGAHSVLQGSVLRLFERAPGWTAIPEATYSIYGERGAIDILAWHAATRSLLIVELKTLLVDPAELVRKMDERRRLARRVGRERGWQPAAVSTWVLLTDTRTNRRHVTGHARVLAPLAAVDGRSMRAWLRAPAAAVSALSFWTEPDAVIARRVRTRRQRGGATPARSATGNLDNLDALD